ncbi:uncharacterized protein LOC129598189 isoform X2 [Paramacrobiotus metropolitanus]|uniref:uncharacterized protein LOC129598189 isoform X2 n=1 Tax=Paramacrobiotus metropolitanus TaxID=2943436 RepID=UPI0024457D08|nr:uncharacterized protein LOC129598189 isoform X2 [Paramacrobiotus metropolitanus]
MPLVNVSVRRGADAHMNCVTNRLQATEKTPAFIWRFNGHVIAAPADHPLQALARAVVDRRGGSVAAERFPLRGISTANQLTFGVSVSSTATTVTSALSISSVDLHTSARVECWVRLEESQEVWRRQIAYLDVITTPAV